MSWNEIKEKYPHQYVALTQIEYGINNATIKNAVVEYTDEDKTFEELVWMYLNGSVLLRYTTLDEDEIGGCV